MSEFLTDTLAKMSQIILHLLLFQNFLIVWEEKKRGFVFIYFGFRYHFSPFAQYKMYLPYIDIHIFLDYIIISK